MHHAHPLKLVSVCCTMSFVLPGIVAEGKREGYLLSSTTPHLPLLCDVVKKKQQQAQQKTIGMIVTWSCVRVEGASCTCINR